MASDRELLWELVGREMSSVEFVRDYLQLRFDGPTINVYTPTTVVAGEERATTWDTHVRNLLCAQISKAVSSVSVEPAEALTLVFVDASVIRISLREQDYRCTEAVYYHGFSNGQWGSI